MGDEQRVLYVPLRSNAHSLLAGAPVAKIRGRLKQASIMFDSIYLESGTLSITAGPSGSMTMPIPVDGQPQFQTPRQRHLAAGQRFFLIGEEAVPGVAAESMRALINSETSVLWMPSLDPFRSELEAGSDWIRFVDARIGSEAKATAGRWKRRDEQNGVLASALPVVHVRRAVLAHANQDLAVAAHGGVSVMQDRLHQSVFDRRFADGSGWKATGFALPLLVPSISDLDWSSVASLRKHPNMKYLRRIVGEMEDFALNESSDGDLESAVRHTFERYVLRAVGKVDGLGAIPRVAVVEMGIGLMSGVATVGFVGPAGIAAGAAVGTAIASGQSAFTMLRSRRSRAWTSAYSRILEAVGDSRYPQS